MTTIAPVPISVATCHHCGKEYKAKPNKEGGVKLPMGWKREENATVCKDCWRERYVLRALTFPVVSPSRADAPQDDHGAAPTSAPWKELTKSLQPLWAETTEASNWMMTQLYVRDVRREDQLKLPAMPKCYLYPEARRLFPNLPPQTVSSLEQAIQRKYRAKRWDVLWVHQASLPTLRYPQPLPIHNQSWKYWFNEGQQPVVEVRIGGSRWHLRLKSGQRFRYQISGLQRMADPGELAIYKAHDGTLLVKLVGWLRRDPKQPSDRRSVLIVRTGKDHLLSALDNKSERLWVENCDHIARMIGEHRWKLQRWSEDQKAEQRPVPGFAARRREAAEKYHRRMDSAIQEVAAHVANFAQRRRYTEVLYDDSSRWLESFPYAALEARLETNLDERQIEFVKEEGSKDEREDSGTN